MPSELNAKQKRIAEFIKGRKKDFISRLSLCGPITDDFLESNAASLDWGCVSSNKRIKWTAELVKKHSDKLDWDNLSRNNLSWSVEFIREHQNKWTWEDLSSNQLLPWSETLIEEFVKKWNWENYGLSQNPKVPWTPEFIKKHGDRFSWETLSENPGLPWSEEFIETYKDKWDWFYLGENHALPWSEDLLERYADKWNWGEYSLSKNPALPWSKLFIEKHIDQINFKGLSNNTGVPWTPELVKEYADRLVWNKDGLSNNPSLPWTEEFIETYKDRLQWTDVFGLTDNTGLPWSEGFIERYENKWDWDRLGNNEAIPWSIGLLEKYQDRWDWNWLSLNHRFWCEVVFSSQDLIQWCLQNLTDDPPKKMPREKKELTSGEKSKLIKQVKRTFQADTVSKKVKPYLYDEVALEGYFHIQPFANVADKSVSMKKVCGNFEGQVFPAIPIGHDGFGVEFWLVLSNGKVITLHHDATFYEVAREVCGDDSDEFMDEFSSEGSYFTIDKLLAFQEMTKELNPEDSGFQEQFLKAAAKSLKWKMKKLLKNIDDKRLEFIFTVCRDFIEANP